MLATKSAIQVAVEGLSGPPRDSKTLSKKSRRKDKRSLKQDQPSVESNAPERFVKRRGASAKSRKKGRNKVKLSSKQQMRRAVKLHEITLKKLFSSDRWTARESGIMKQVDDLENEVARLKAIVGTSQKTRRIRDRSKPKSTMSLAVMNMKPRHHSTKVYISPEQRAINKAKDGKPTMNLSKSNNATRLQAVGGSTKALPKGVVRNAKPRSRKERLKSEFVSRRLAKEFERLNLLTEGEVHNKAA